MPRSKKKTADAKPTIVNTKKRSDSIDAGLREQFLAEHSDDKNVGAAEKKGRIECACCGKPITEGNGVYASRRIFYAGYHPVCLPCQQKLYAEMAANTSRTYALFYACVRFDLPYKPDVIAEITANQNGVWYEYVKKLQMGMTMDLNGRGETWLDGITDITEAFGGEFPVLPITGDVLVANMSEMSDRERWNIEWGEKWNDADCHEMDERFMMLTANRSGGTVPASVSMYLHDAIKYMILRDKSSDSMEAKRYQEMADKLMNSEYMKNWQANKGETIQVDRVVRYLENIGAMQNGYLIGYDDLVKVLSGQHGNYNTSLDIVDCMMMCIVNTMRKNQGEAELTKLPITAQVKDEKGELLSEISAEEKKILEGLGMKPPEREGAM